MTIGIVIPTVSSVSTLDTAVRSVLNQEYETEILLVQNGDAVSEKCAEWEKLDNVFVHRPYFNLGCSASWNVGCEFMFDRGHDKTFLMNDDFELLDTDILTKIDKAYEDFSEAHYHLWGFSAVSVSEDLYEKVGGFDEGFWPAYYEDNDYYYRSVNLGIRWEGITNIHVNHITSSSTQSSPWLNRLNSKTFPLNHARYVAKWGGDPHHETFTEPWNGKEPTFGKTRELMSEMGWTEWYA